MRTFIMGDIHGNVKALHQCLERCGFDKENDRLIQLGDVADGWPYVYECVEELLTIKHRIDILGNHDLWFQQWLLDGNYKEIWISQGGWNTCKSYARAADLDLSDGLRHANFHPGCIPAAHKEFFLNQRLYYIEGAALFIHAGYDRKRLIKEIPFDEYWNFYWDRDLFGAALSCKGVQLKSADRFKEFFIGHTACAHLHDGHPVMQGGLINLDTGAGWDGKLTIMERETLAYWQSDSAYQLYNKINPR